MHKYNISKFTLYKIGYSKDIIVIYNKLDNKEILCAKITHLDIELSLKAIFDDIQYLSDNCKYNGRMQKVNLHNFDIPIELSNNYYICNLHSKYIIFYDKYTKLQVYCINCKNPRYKEIINNAIEYLTYFSQY